MAEDIKDVFKALAKYNKLTNQDMVKVLETIGPVKLIEDLSPYFTSIMGILNHHLHADIGWLRVLGSHASNLALILSLLERFPTEHEKIKISFNTLFGSLILIIDCFMLLSKL